MTILLVPATLSTNITFDVKFPLEKKSDLNSNPEIQQRIADFFIKKYIEYLNTTGKKSLQYIAIRGEKLVALKQPDPEHISEKLEFIKKNILFSTNMLSILNKVVRKTRINWVSLPQHVDFVVKLIGKHITHEYMNE